MRRAIIVFPAIAGLIVGSLILLGYPKIGVRRTVNDAYVWLLKGGLGERSERISPSGLRAFKVIEGKYGRVLSFRIEDVYVQVLGDPWGADVLVHRERGDCLERVGGSGREVRVVQLIKEP